MQSVTREEVRVTHWARGAHDLTIFQVFWKQKGDHMSIMQPNKLEFDLLVVNYVL